MEKAGKLSLAEQFLPPCLSSEQTQAQRRGPLCIYFVPIRGLEIAKDLSSLSVRDAAVRLKPVPSTPFREVECFKPPNQCFTRYPKV